MDDKWMEEGMAGMEGCMDGCLERHEEEEVMQVFYSLNNKSQNI